MKYAARIMGLAVASMLAVPQFAFAASESIVPEWLSLAAAGVGLLTAALVLIDAVLLRRATDGSMIAENIGYMMLSVLCLAASMLARWFGVLVDDAELTSFISFGADLLVTVGLALLAVYFIRLRAALMRYLADVRAYAASAQVPVEDAPASESGEPRG